MKEVIHTDKAPAAIGPYSQAIKVGNMVYTAGQIALDPETGNLNISSLENEVGQVMSNLSNILEAAGSSMANVVKTTIFLADLNLYSKVNELYASYFENNPPARSTIEVSKLPKNVNLEIEMIAVSE